jgi:hypothetical protein
VDHIKIRDAEDVGDQPVEEILTTTPLKAQRGRPPGRRKEAESSLNSEVVGETEISSNATANHQTSGRPSRLARSRTGTMRVNNDKPIFTLSVAAEILHLHPRTLRIYEEHNLVVPTRTKTNRRRYSQNDIKKFQFIQYLTRERGVNLSGVKIILALLEEIRKTVSDPITQSFPDYGDGEGFPLI